MLSYVSGPPFTHQCAPEHMIYYGQSSCESDLDRYLESLKSLWRRRSQSRETPVIINTMGWVKGQLTPASDSSGTLNVLIVNSVWTCACLGCPQGLDFSCWWTWSASSRSRMSSSSVTVASHSVHLSLRSFWGRHRASRRTHLPRPLWTSSQRATFPREVTLTSSSSQSFKEWRAKEQRKLKISNDQIVLALTAKHFPSDVVLRRYVAICRKHQRSNEHRELSLLAYLSQLQSPDPGPVRPLHSLTPYQVHESQDPAQFMNCYKCVKKACKIFQVTS